MSTALKTHYDVVIIGAGMVGSSLACVLGNKADKQGRYLLIEANAISAEAPAQPGYDTRSTVLSAGSVGYFESLGLWSQCQGAAEPIAKIQVSDQGRFGSVKLDSVSEGVSALGYVVENVTLGTTLNAAISDCAGLDLCAPAKVDSIRPGADGMTLSLIRDGETIQVSAQLVVLAEGGRSGLCQQLGIAQQVSSYGQHAIIANVSFSKPHQQVAFERFTSKGPLALLPLPDHAGEHRAALVWTHQSGEHETILALADAEFLDALQQDFGYSLGEFTRVGQRASYPLNLQLATEQVRPGLVLLGNVAHTLHPVAGQGFNLALRDTMLLAENIMGSLGSGQNPGDFNRLQTYLAKARGDQDITVLFSDYMTRLFSNNSAPQVLLRHLGMAGIDLFPPLRKQLSRQAMGLAHPRVSVG